MSEEAENTVEYVFAIVFLGSVTAFYLLYSASAFGFLLTRTVQRFILGPDARFTVGALTFSPLRMRIFFKDVRYFSLNSSVKVVDGYLTFQFWGNLFGSDSWRPVRLPKKASSGTGSGPPSTATSPRNRTKKEKGHERTSSAPTFVQGQFTTGSEVVSDDEMMSNVGSQTASDIEHFPIPRRCRTCVDGAWVLGHLVFVNAKKETAGMRMESLGRADGSDVVEFPIALVFVAEERGRVRLHLNGLSLSIHNNYSKYETIGKNKRSEAEQSAEQSQRDSGAAAHYPVSAASSSRRPNTQNSGNDASEEHAALGLTGEAGGGYAESAFERFMGFVRAVEFEATYSTIDVGGIGTSHPYFLHLDFAKMSGRYTISRNGVSSFDRYRNVVQVSMTQASCRWAHTSEGRGASAAQSSPAAASAGASSAATAGGGAGPTGVSTGNEATTSANPGGSATATAKKSRISLRGLRDRITKGAALMLSGDASTGPNALSRGGAPTASSSGVRSSDLIKVFGTVLDQKSNASIGIVYYWDVEGVQRGEAIDVGTLPKTGLEVEIDTDELHYGPWSDLCRKELMRHFFPLDYKPWEVFVPRIGEPRPFGVYEQHIELTRPTRVIVPFKHKRVTPSPPWGIEDSGRVGTVVLDVAAGLSYTYNVPWVVFAEEKAILCETRFHMPHITIHTSMNDSPLLKATAMNVWMDALYPLLWNDRQQWDVMIQLIGSQIWFYSDHQSIMWDLLADWGYASAMYHKESIARYTTWEYNTEEYVPYAQRYEFFFEPDTTAPAFQNAPSATTSATTSTPAATGGGGGPTVSVPGPGLRLYWNTNEGNVVYSADATSFEENSFFVISAQTGYVHYYCPLDNYCLTMENEFKYRYTISMTGVELGATYASGHPMSQKCQPGKPEVFLKTPKLDVDGYFSSIYLHVGNGLPASREARDDHDRTNSSVMNIAVSGLRGALGGHHVSVLGAWWANYFTEACSTVSPAEFCWLSSILKEGEIGRNLKYPFYAFQTRNDPKRNDLEFFMHLKVEAIDLFFGTPSEGGVNYVCGLANVTSHSQSTMTDLSVSLAPSLCKFQRSDGTPEKEMFIAIGNIEYGKMHFYGPAPDFVVFHSSGSADISIVTASLSLENVALLSHISTVFSEQAKYFDSALKQACLTAVRDAQRDAEADAQEVNIGGLRRGVSGRWTRARSTVASGGGGAASTGRGSTWAHETAAAAAAAATGAVLGAGKARSVACELATATRFRLNTSISQETATEFAGYLERLQSLQEMSSDYGVFNLRCRVAKVSATVHVRHAGVASLDLPHGVAFASSTLNDTNSNHRSYTSVPVLAIRFFSLKTADLMVADVPGNLLEVGSIETSVGATTSTAYPLDGGLLNHFAKQRDFVRDCDHSGLVGINFEDVLSLAHLNDMARHAVFQSLASASVLASGLFGAGAGGSAQNHAGGLPSFAVPSTPLSEAGDGTGGGGTGADGKGTTTRASAASAARAGTNATAATANTTPAKNKKIGPNTDGTDVVIVDNDNDDDADTDGAGLLSANSGNFMSCRSGTESSVPSEISPGSTRQSSHRSESSTDSDGESGMRASSSLLHHATLSPGGPRRTVEFNRCLRPFDLRFDVGNGTLMGYNPSAKFGSTHRASEGEIFRNMFHYQSCVPSVVIVPVATDAVNPTGFGTWGASTRGSGDGPRSSGHDEDEFLWALRPSDNAPRSCEGVTLHHTHVECIGPLRCYVTPRCFKLLIVMEEMFNDSTGAWENHRAAATAFAASATTTFGDGDADSRAAASGAAGASAGRGTVPSRRRSSGGGRRAMQEAASTVRDAEQGRGSRSKNRAKQWGSTEKIVSVVSRLVQLQFVQQLPLPLASLPVGSSKRVYGIYDSQAIIEGMQGVYLQSAPPVRLTGSNSSVRKRATKTTAGCRVTNASAAIQTVWEALPRSGVYSPSLPGLKLDPQWGFVAGVGFSNFVLRGKHESAGVNYATVSRLELETGRAYATRDVIAYAQGTARYMSHLAAQRSSAGGSGASRNATPATSASRSRSQRLEEGQSPSTPALQPTIEPPVLLQPSLSGGFMANRDSDDDLDDEDDADTGDFNPLLLIQSEDAAQHVEGVARVGELFVELMEVGRTPNGKVIDVALSQPSTMRITSTVVSYTSTTPAASMGARPPSATAVADCERIALRVFPSVLHFMPPSSGRGSHAGGPTTEPGPPSSGGFADRPAAPFRGQPHKAPQPPSSGGSSRNGPSAAPPPASATRTAAMNYNYELVVRGVEVQLCDTDYNYVRFCAAKTCGTTSRFNDPIAAASVLLKRGESAGAVPTISPFVRQKLAARATRARQRAAAFTEPPTATAAQSMRRSSALFTQEVSVEYCADVSMFRENDVDNSLLPTDFPTTRRGESPDSTFNTHVPSSNQDGAGRSARVLSVTLTSVASSLQSALIAPTSGDSGAQPHEHDNIHLHIGSTDCSFPFRPVMVDVVHPQFQQLVDVWTGAIAAALEAPPSTPASVSAASRSSGVSRASGVSNVVGGRGLAQMPSTDFASLGGTAPPSPTHGAGGSASASPLPHRGAALGGVGSQPTPPAPPPPPPPGPSVPTGSTTSTSSNPAVSRATRVIAFDAQAIVLTVGLSRGVLVALKIPQVSAWMTDSPLEQRLAVRCHVRASQLLSKTSVSERTLPLPQVYGFYNVDGHRSNTTIMVDSLDAVVTEDLFNHVFLTQEKILVELLPLLGSRVDSEGNEPAQGSNASFSPEPLHSRTTLVVASSRVSLLNTMCEACFAVGAVSATTETSNAKTTWSANVEGLQVSLHDRDDYNHRAVFGTQGERPQGGPSGGRSHHKTSSSGDTSGGDPQAFAAWEDRERGRFGGGFVWGLVRCSFRVSNTVPTSSSQPTTEFSGTFSGTSSSAGTGSTAAPPRQRTPPPTPSMHAASAPLAWPSGSGVFGSGGTPTVPAAGLAASWSSQHPHDRGDFGAASTTSSSPTVRGALCVWANVMLPTVVVRAGCAELVTGFRAEYRQSIDATREEMRTSDDEVRRKVENSRQYQRLVLRANHLKSSMTAQASISLQDGRGGSGVGDNGYPSTLVVLVVSKLIVLSPIGDRGFASLMGGGGMSVSCDKVDRHTHSVSCLDRKRFVPFAAVKLCVDTITFSGMHEASSAGFVGASGFSKSTGKIRVDGIRFFISDGTKIDTKQVNVLQLLAKGTLLGGVGVLTEWEMGEFNRSRNKLYMEATEVQLCTETTRGRSTTMGGCIAWPPEVHMSSRAPILVQMVSEEHVAAGASTLFPRTTLSGLASLGGPASPQGTGSGGAATSAAMANSAGSGGTGTSGGASAIAKDEITVSVVEFSLKIEAGTLAMHSMHLASGASEVVKRATHLSSRRQGLTFLDPQVAANTTQLFQIPLPSFAVLTTKKSELISETAGFGHATGIDVTLNWQPVEIPVTLSYAVREMGYWREVTASDRRERATLLVTTVKLLEEVGHQTKILPPLHVSCLDAILPLPRCFAVKALEAHARSQMPSALRRGSQTTSPVPQGLGASTSSTSHNGRAKDTYTMDVALHLARFKMSLVCTPVSTSAITLAGDEAGSVLLDVLYHDSVLPAVEAESALPMPRSRAGPLSLDPSLFGFTDGQRCGSFVFATLRNLRCECQAKLELKAFESSISEVNVLYSMRPAVASKLHVSVPLAAARKDCVEATFRAMQASQIFLVLEMWRRNGEDAAAELFPGRVFPILTPQSRRPSPHHRPPPTVASPAPAPPVKLKRTGEQQPSPAPLDISVVIERFVLRADFGVSNKQELVVTNAVLERKETAVVTRSSAPGFVARTASRSGGAMHDVSFATALLKSDGQLSGEVSLAKGVALRFLELSPGFLTADLAAVKFAVELPELRVSYKERQLKDVCMLDVTKLAILVRDVQYPSRRVSGSLQVQRYIVGLTPMAAPAFSAMANSIEALFATQHREALARIEHAKFFKPVSSSPTPTSTASLAGGGTGAPLFPGAAPASSLGTIQQQQLAAGAAAGGSDAEFVSFAAYGAATGGSGCLSSDGGSSTGEGRPFIPFTASPTMRRIPVGELEFKLSNGEVMLGAIVTASRTNEASPSGVVISLPSVVVSFAECAAVAQNTGAGSVSPPPQRHVPVAAASSQPTAVGSGAAALASGTPSPLTIKRVVVLQLTSWEVSRPTGKRVAILGCKGTNRFELYSSQGVGSPVVGYVFNFRQTQPWSGSSHVADFEALNATIRSFTVPQAGGLTPEPDPALSAVPGEAMEAPSPMSAVTLAGRHVDPGASGSSLPSTSRGATPATGAGGGSAATEERRFVPLKPSTFAPELRVAGDVSFSVDMLLGWLGISEGAVPLLLYTGLCDPLERLLVAVDENIPDFSASATAIARSETAEGRAPGAGRVSWS